MQKIFIGASTRMAMTVMASYASIKKKSSAENRDREGFVKTATLS